MPRVKKKETDEQPEKDNKLDAIEAERKGWLEKRDMARAALAKKPNDEELREVEEEANARLMLCNLELKRLKRK